MLAVVDVGSEGRGANCGERRRRMRGTGEKDNLAEVKGAGVLGKKY